MKQEKLILSPNPDLEEFGLKIAMQRLSHQIDDAAYNNLLYGYSKLLSLSHPSILAHRIKQALLFMNLPFSECYRLGIGKINRIAPEYQALTNKTVYVAEPIYKNGHPKYGQIYRAPIIVTCDPKLYGLAVTENQSTIITPVDPIRRGYNSRENGSRLPTTNQDVQYLTPTLSFLTQHLEAVHAAKFVK